MRKRTQIHKKTPNIAMLDHQVGYLAGHHIVCDIIDYLVGHINRYHLVGTIEKITSLAGFNCLIKL